MRKHYFLITLLLLCSLIIGGVYAHASQGKGPGGSSGEVSDPKGDRDQDRDCTPDQDPIQDQTRDRDRTGQDEEAPYFTAQDGNTYMWQHKFNRKLSRYDERGDAQAMHKYLEKIAGRYTFEHNSEVDDFVNWAFQNRPWDTE